MGSEGVVHGMVINQVGGIGVKVILFLGSGDKRDGK